MIKSTAAVSQKTIQVPFARDPRAHTFIRKLAEYLAGSAAHMSVLLEMGKPEAQLWAEMRSPTPLMGWLSVDEAEKVLAAWFERWARKAPALSRRMKVPFAQDRRAPTFIRKLAEYLTGECPRNMAVPGGRMDEMWSDLRAATPVVRGQSADEAEKVLTAWFERVEV